MEFSTYSSSIPKSFKAIKKAFRLNNRSTHKNSQRNVNGPELNAPATSGGTLNFRKTQFRPRTPKKPRTVWFIVLHTEIRLDPVNFSRRANRTKQRGGTCIFSGRMARWIDSFPSSFMTSDTFLNIDFIADIHISMYIGAFAAWITKPLFYIQKPKTEDMMSWWHPVYIVRRQWKKNTPSCPFVCCDRR